MRHWGSAHQWPKAATPRQQPAQAGAAAAQAATAPQQPTRTNARTAAAQAIATPQPPTRTPPHPEALDSRAIAAPSPLDPSAGPAANRGRPSAPATLPAIRVPASPTEGPAPPPPPPTPRDRPARKVTPSSTSRKKFTELVNPVSEDALRLTLRDILPEGMVEGGVSGLTVSDAVDAVLSNTVGAGNIKNTGRNEGCDVDGAGGDAGRPTGRDNSKRREYYREYMKRRRAEARKDKEGSGS